MERNGNREQRSLIPRSFFPNLWEEMEGRIGQWMGREVDTGVSVSEDDQNVYVEAQLPGLKSDDIDVSLSQDTLWIKGEKQEEEEGRDKKYYRRARNTFFYQVALPSQVEESSEKADFQDGILKITFKKTKQSQVRKISIGNGRNQTQSKNGGNQTKGNKQS